MKALIILKCLLKPYNDIGQGQVEYGIICQADSKHANLCVIQECVSAKG